MSRIPAGNDPGVRDAKRSQRERGALSKFHIVEVPGNGRTMTIPANKPRLLSAYKYTEGVNAKLTPLVSSGIRGQLTTNKLSIV